MLENITPPKLDPFQENPDLRQLYRDILRERSHQLNSWALPLLSILQLASVPYDLEHFPGEIDIILSRIIMVLIPLICSGLTRFRNAHRHAHTLMTVTILSIILGLAYRSARIPDDMSQVIGMIAVLIAPPLVPAPSRYQLAWIWSGIVGYLLVITGLYWSIPLPPVFTGQIYNVIFVGILVSILVHTMGQSQKKQFINQQRLYEEKKVTTHLLHNVLPQEVVEEFQREGSVAPTRHDAVSILFTDFIGFTAIAAQFPPKDLVNSLNKYFLAFDEICMHYNLERIKTIGDAYMAAAGVPQPNATHAQASVNCALDILDSVQTINSYQNGACFEVRVGIHTGPVVAGVVGSTRFHYDLWGDAVNIASRMESNSAPGRLTVSGATASLLSPAEFEIESRGPMVVKGKGQMELFFVSRISTADYSKPNHRIQ